MNPDSEKKTNASCGCGGGRCGSGPGKWIWLALAAAVAGVLIARNASRRSVAAAPAAGTVCAATGAVPGAAAAPQSQALPRLVDLGAGKCIPCKMMAPVLEELKKSYAGRLEIVFLDVWENPDAGKKYGINMIPTQIFYDAAGQELFRHEGFFGRDDILAKWRELGVNL